MSARTCRLTARFGISMAFEVHYVTVRESPSTPSFAKLCKRNAAPRLRLLSAVKTGPQPRTTANRNSYNSTNLRCPFPKNARSLSSLVEIHKDLHCFHQRLMREMLTGRSLIGLPFRDLRGLRPRRRTAPGRNHRSLRSTIDYNATATRKSSTVTLLSIRVFLLMLSPSSLHL